jgi:cobalamin biosynthesis protein CbiD
MVDPIITPLAIKAIVSYLAAHTALALVAVVGIVSLVALGEWFQEREQVLEKNKNALAFTIGSMIDSKQYVEIPGLFGSHAGTTKLVQGIYDSKANKILDMRAVVSNKVEPEIAKAHAKQKLVIYPR